MYTRDAFRPADPARAFDLIESIRLGTMVTKTAEDGFLSSQMAFTVDRARGRYGTLASHLPYANPQSRAILAGAECLVIFLGTHGYVSSSWYPPAGRDSAPTWNFAAVHAVGCAVPLDRAGTASHIRELVEALERGRPERWRLGEMGARFRALLDRIVAFEVPVERLVAKLKMGQDERPADTAAAIEALARGDAAEQALAEEMRRCAVGGGTSGPHGSTVPLPPAGRPACAASRRGQLETKG